MYSTNFSLFLYTGRDRCHLILHLFNVAGELVILLEKATKVWITHLEIVNLIVQLGEIVVEVMVLYRQVTSLLSGIA